VIRTTRGKRGTETSKRKKTNPSPGAGGKTGGKKMPIRMGKKGAANRGCLGGRGGNKGEGNLVKTTETELPPERVEAGRSSCTPKDD